MKKKKKKKKKTLKSRKNNYFKYNKKNKSLEKLKIKGKISFLDNRKNNNNILKYNNNNIKSNKYDKFLTNMNEMKNKYFSNYYDYFIKTKIINNSIKYQNSLSINQDSNNISRSKSISQQKMKKNLTQRINIRNRNKKEKSVSNTINTISSINHQRLNNNI